MKIWKIENKAMFYNDILGINEDELAGILSDKNKKKYYGIPIEIPKKSGKRTIYSINNSSKIYIIQKRLCDKFLHNILLPDTVHGFRKDTNYIEYLLPHICFYKDYFYLRLDIRNFFESINTASIKEALEYYFKINKDFTAFDIKIILNRIIDILTYDNKLVQGAPTSPIISNLVFRKLDIRIEKYCRCFQINYTRYADDMLFSSNNPIILKKSFISGVSKIIATENLYLNYNKVVRAKNQISLGGYVISDNIRLSRSKLSNLSRVLFYVENHKDYKNQSYYEKLNDFLKSEMGTDYLKINGIYELINYFAGNRAFIISVLKYSHDDNFCEKAKKIIKRLDDIIIKLDNTVAK
ncbi:reverse transcriptase family protein [Anaerocolumna sp. AGMB13025]|uniref:reverse transcriptase family protein n=1 Tax=Anaerocolumna sp. AGMB13025 TaxID=3039116 RepID=UPI00241F146B|nr:reverse transcriptase family protein [Anaerocolumna sp. AGMB13025]WFR57324.1 reverse transcriptase family protein [Anaerocolumna sp. AGMB13025]